MSLHTITLLTRWSLTVKDQDLILIEELRKVQSDERRHDTRLIEVVRKLYNSWSRGNKIERIATLGWNEAEVCSIFNELLNNLPLLRDEYAKGVAAFGMPPELSDKDLDKYEKAVQEFKNM